MYPPFEVYLAALNHFNFHVGSSGVLMLVSLIDFDENNGDFTEAEKVCQTISRPIFTRKWQDFMLETYGIRIFQCSNSSGSSAGVARASTSIFQNMRYIPKCLQFEQGAGQS